MSSSRVCCSCLAERCITCCRRRWQFQALSVLLKPKSGSAMLPSARRTLKPQKTSRCGSGLSKHQGTTLTGAGSGQSSSLRPAPGARCRAIRRLGVLITTNGKGYAGCPRVLSSASRSRNVFRRALQSFQGAVLLAEHGMIADALTLCAAASRLRLRWAMLSSIQSL
jgi:hypothetical protein